MRRPPSTDGTKPDDAHQLAGTLVPTDSVRQRRAQFRDSALLVLLGLLVIAAYSSIGRPLWIDEFVHFSLGGLAPADAMVAIVATTGASLNQGHTGVYLLVDYWLMQAFGANLLALRLPSILSGVVLLASAATFIRVKGFGLGWRALAIVAFGANASLMYYTGEARPYMPLAAACLATLTYYQFPLDTRHRLTVRAFGVIGILGGAVCHPYFALFGPVIALYSLWERGHLSRPRDVRRMIQFLNPRLVLAAAFLFVVVGLLSWAKGRPSHSHDPWYWFASASDAIDAIAVAHIESLRPFAVPTVVIVAGLALTSLLLVRTVGPAVVVRPLALIAVGICSSVVLTLASMIGHYWVFVRQGVGGIALATLGLVWLLAASWEASSRRRGVRALLIALVGVVVLSGAVRVSQNLAQIPENLASWGAFEGGAGVVPDIPVSERSGEDWVELGNRNIATGGSVWPEVAEFYLQWKKER